MNLEACLGVENKEHEWNKNALPCLLDTSSVDFQWVVGSLFSLYIYLFLRRETPMKQSEKQAAVNSAVGKTRIAPDRTGSDRTGPYQIGSDRIDKARTTSVTKFPTKRRRSPDNVLKSGEVEFCVFLPCVVVSSFIETHRNFFSRDDYRFRSGIMKDTM